MSVPRPRAVTGAETLQVAIGHCSLGALLVVFSTRGICAIELGDNPQTMLAELQQRFAPAQLLRADATFAPQLAQVAGWLEQVQAPWCLALDIRGSAFQQRVWQALQQTTAGQTLSYSELAARIGQPKACRAVASACAANHLAVVIPCHRILRQDGSLSGYRWGVARKRQLLEREQACASQVGHGA